MVVQGLVDESSPFCAIVHHFLPIGKACQVFMNDINPSQGVSPGGLSFPWGLLFKICRCGQWVGILIRCPNHWSRFILSWSLTIACPHFSRTSALRHLSHRVRPRMSRRHRIWKVVSFWMSLLCHGPCLCAVEE